MSGTDEMEAEAERRFPDDFSSEAVRYASRAIFVQGVKWHEAKLIEWLIDIHYPFDMTFDNPPPIDMTKLALRWKERDGWDCTDEEAIDLIQGEAIPLTPSPA